MSDMNLLADDADYCTKCGCAISGTFCLRCEGEPWECDRCDGCGWYEGGECLKTTCEVCGGTGVVTKLAATPEPR